MNLNKDLKVLRNNFISLLTLKVGNYLIPLITLPFLIQVLGVEKFGLVAFAEMIIMYFKSIVDYGFDLSGTRSISENKDDKKELNIIVNSIYGVKFLLSCVCFLFLLVLIMVIPQFKVNIYLFIYSYGIVVGNAMLPIWFFQGVEKMKYITILNFLSRLFYLLLLFLFIDNNTDYYKVPLLSSVGLVFSGLLSMYIMKKKFDISFYIPKFIDIKAILKKDFNIFITTLTPNLYNNSMGVLLGVFTNNIQVGYYTAAIKVIEIGNSVIYIISTTIYPYLNRNLNYRKKLLNWTMIVGAVVSIFFMIFGEVIINILFGDEMNSSVIILRILSISPFFISMMSVYGTNTLILNRKDKLVRNIVLIFSLLGFLLGAIFIQIYEVIAAAVILIVIRGGIGISELYYSKKNKANKNFNVKLKYE